MNTCMFIFSPMVCIRWTLYLSSYVSGGHSTYLQIIKNCNPDNKWKHSCLFSPTFYDDIHLFARLTIFLSIVFAWPIFPSMQYLYISLFRIIRSCNPENGWKHACLYFPLDALFIFRILIINGNIHAYFLPHFMMRFIHLLD